MAQAQYAGTGRRKNAVARVRLVPGTGKITVNKKDVEEDVYKRQLYTSELAGNTHAVIEKSEYSSLDSHTTSVSATI